MTSILESKKEIENILLGIEEVQGVGISSDRQSIIVYVSTVTDQLLQIVPGVIAGYRVIVKEVGIFKPSQDFVATTADPTRLWRYRPVVGGISSGHYAITAGTLGCVVKDATTGQPMLLSNNHVYAAISTDQTQRAQVSDPVLQPGCFSEDTRVLTRDGFKYFYELQEEDEICTLNIDTHNIEYQKPTKIHNYEYNGDLILFDGQMYNLLVTPNHNLLVRINKNDRLELIAAEELHDGVMNSYKEVMKIKKDIEVSSTSKEEMYRKISSITGINKHTLKGWITTEKKPTISNNCTEFIKNGIWNGIDKETFEIPSTIGVNTKGIIKFNMEDWLEFLGWYISEGSLGGPKAEEQHNYIISIRQYSKKNLEEIENVIIRMGFTPNVRWEHGSITFNSKELHNYLKQFGYAKDKFIPKDLKNLSIKYLNILLKSLFKGDGSFVKERNDQYNDTYLNNVRRYHTISKQLSEDVAEIALKCGYGVSIRFVETNIGIGYIYRVGISSRNLTPRITKKPTTEKYSGVVYDVTVPNHTLLVERKGKIIWSGNSYDGGRIEDTVGTLARWIPIKVNSANAVDAAIANSTYQPSPYILGENNEYIQVKRLKTVTQGIPVKKAGRTTGLTVGNIIDTDYTGMVDYNDGQVLTFTDQLLVSIMIQGGDSGSLLLDENDNAVGLLFAGSQDNYGNYYGVANKINTVFSLLQIELPSGEEPEEPEPEPESNGWLAALALAAPIALLALGSIKMNGK